MVLLTNGSKIRTCTPIQRRNRWDDKYFKILLLVAEVFNIVLFEYAGLGNVIGKS